MIPGIVASAMSSAVTAGLPAAVADIQFDVGTAIIDGATVDIDDLLSRPENLVPGQGMVLGQDFSCEILGDLAALLLTTDWTIAINWFRPADFSTPLEINDGVEATSYPKIRIEDSTGYFLTFDTKPSPPLERDLVGNDLPAPVARAMGLRRTDVQIAMSLDLADVVTEDTFSDLPAMARVWIGGNSTSSYGFVVLQRLRVYASTELTTDLLPQVSAPDAVGVAGNDVFANALPIEPGQTLYVWSSGASKQSGEPNHGGEAGGASVWYEFTAPASGDCTVIIWNWTNLSAPIIAVYTGSAVDSLTPIVSDVNDAWEVTFTATMGTSYKIALDGVGGEEGFFSIRVPSPAAPGDDELLLLLL
jgi:hypothetical protein